MKLPFGSLWAEFKAFAFKGNMIELAVAVVIGAAFGKVINSLCDDIIMPTVGYAIHTGQQVAAKAADVAADAKNAVAAKTGLATSQPTTAPAADLPTTPPAADKGMTPDPSAIAKVPAMPEIPTALSQAGLTAAFEKALENRAAADKAAADKAAAKKAADDAAAAPMKIDLAVGPVPIGKFVSSLLNFIIVAFAVFIMIVKLLGGVMKKMQKAEAPSAPTTRECPECLSLIPVKAKRCSHCTAIIAPAM